MNADARLGRRRAQIDNDLAAPAVRGQPIFAKQLPYIHFTPSVPGIADVRIETLDPAINEAVLLKKEPEAALDEAASKADQLLKENKQKYQAA